MTIFKSNYTLVDLRLIMLKLNPKIVKLDRLGIKPDPKISQPSKACNLTDKLIG